MASLVGLEIFLLIGNNKNKVENENVKIENQNTKLTEFNVSEDVSIYCDQNWKQTEYEDDEGKFELLDYKNAEMSLSFVSEENLGDEYSLSDESGRELLYNNFFIGFDEIDEPKDRSERFQLLNNNLYYIYFGTYNNLFDVYQRFYVVINSNTEQGYIFEISAKNQFTKEQEKSILKVLSTVKSK